MRTAHSYSSQFYGPRQKSVGTLIPYSRLLYMPPELARDRRHAALLLPIRRTDPELKVKVHLTEGPEFDAAFARALEILLNGKERTQ